MEKKKKIKPTLKILIPMETEPPMERMISQEIPMKIPIQTEVVQETIPIPTMTTMVSPMKKKLKMEPIQKIPTRTTMASMMERKLKMERIPKTRIQMETGSMTERKNKIEPTHSIQIQMVMD